MRGPALATTALAVALAGCGTATTRVVVAPDDSLLSWAGQLGQADPVPDRAMVSRIRRYATASGARAVAVTILQPTPPSEPRHIPVVTLEARDPAAYLAHRLEGFLRAIGYLRVDGRGYVEVVDANGRFVWAAGRFANGGMVKVRPDLDSCSPIHHSQPVGLQPPPCPA